MNELEDKYGSVVKLTGPLGVCFLMTRPYLVAHNYLSQSRILFVFDPKALQHVVVKDQYTYDQSTFTTRYVA